MMEYKGIVLADIHIGAFNIDKLYDELSLLFNYLETNKVDFIIICGDYFDKKLFLNDKESLYAYIIMNNILEICKKYKTKVRIVYGTESHECNQYNILSKLNNQYDIKIIKNVSDEELLPGLNVLYLPEEHIYDKNDHYGSFFEKEKYYDYIFGHGIIREVMKEAATLIENKSGHRRKVPVFSTAELNRICRGQTYFGHFHINSNLGDRVFYIGSFSRWQFGEEERKGFYEIGCNIKKDEYKNKFIENTNAETYHTIYFGYDNDIFKSIDNMEKKLNNIDKLINTKAFDHLRFEFNIPENAENPEYMINYINEKYKYKNNIKVEIVHGYINQKRKHDKENIKKENEKYEILFDKNISIEDKISYFIKIEYNREIKTERISKYLYSNINEIINN